MVMNYKEVPISDKDKKRFAKGIAIVNALAESLHEQDFLPERFSQTSKTKMPRAQETGKTVKSAKTEWAGSSLSKETQKLIERMEKDGYGVYQASSKTPGSLREKGMRYSYLNPKLEDLTAGPAILAFKIDPSRFYLRGSQNIPFEDQVKLLPEEQERVDKEYKSAGLIVRVGHFPEWPELALMHFKKTGVRIHGKDYGYNWTWTDTYESDQQGADRAVAGYWAGTVGFYGYFWSPGVVFPSLRLAPLVVIPRK